MNNNKHENGQAMIELTVMLIAITAMILAVIFLSGYEITNNQLLLDARNRAQLSARNRAEDFEGGNEFYSWNYPSVDLNKSYIQHKKNSGNDMINNQRESLFHYGNTTIRFFRRNESETPVIPFTVSTSPVRSGTVNSVKNVHFAFNDGNNSATMGRYERYYQWRKLKDFDVHWFEHDFSEVGNMGNALDTANLIGRGPAGSGAPATLSSREQARGNHSNSNAQSVMYKTFGLWFGINPRKIKLDESITNQVFMPQTYRKTYL